MFRYIKNEKGIALVSVLVILTVTSLLGATVWQASAQETLSSETDENQTQAYYFARSGVEMAVGLIKDGYFDDLSINEKKQFYGKLDDIGQEETDDYNIKFGVLLDESDNFIIESLGIVRKGEATGATAAESDLKFAIARGDINNGGTGGSGGGTGGTGSSIALFSDEGLTFKGSAGINGDVLTNSVERNSVDFASSTFIKNGNLYIGPDADWNEVVKFKKSPATNIPDGEILNLSSTRSYPLPAFPQFPKNLEYRGDLDTKWISGEYYEISDNESTDDGYYQFGSYGSITVRGNRTLVIKLDGEDRVLRVKNLDIKQGKIVLQGEGKLKIYVENDFSIGGGSKVNNGGNNNSLDIYYKGDKKGKQKLKFAGNTAFVGSIFAQSANVSLSGSNNIDGNIITGGSKVSVSGNADGYPLLMYAPNADLKVTGSGIIRGTAVVKEGTLTGNSRIKADNSIDTTFFNSLDWGESGPPSLFKPEQEQEETSSSWRGKGTWIKI
ncbi:MAG: hypothetical protein FH758_09880 [Firmicutes bacterium]|nr:hypothetical protein [Bacillota bacterium]